MRGFLNGLDLFSGYGGISLALKDWVKPVAYCEIDRYAQSILLSRMSEGLLPKAPIWDDIRTLEKRYLPQIDLVYGGFPCQDISVAGNGKGLAGERSGLFFEVCRLVEEIKPPFVFLENVPAIRTRGLRRVIRQFTDMGYDCRWACVSAQEVGAPHIRKRWFLLAKSRGRRCRESGKGKMEFQGGAETERPSPIAYANQLRKEHSSSDVANPDKGGLQAKGSEQQATRFTGKGLQSIYGKSQLMADSNEKRLPTERAKFHLRQPCKCGGPWEAEPAVGRVVDGCPARVDRIKALGNGVVPAQVIVAFERLLEGS